MARRRSLRLALLAAASLATGTAQAESQLPPQPLAVLLKQLNVNPLSLYDGISRLRVPQTDGGSLTISATSGAFRPVSPPRVGRPSRATARSWVRPGLSAPGAVLPQLPFSINAF